MCPQRTQRITRIAFPISFQIDNGVFIAKFVVSRCVFANFQWVFLFCQSFEVGAVLITMHSPILARKNKTENDSRLVKISEGNRDDEWNF